MHFASIRRNTLRGVALLVGSLLCAGADEVQNIPEIGAHQPILTVAKNVNPQNVMVVYTKTDTNGQFLKSPNDPSRPMLDFYWLMDGKSYKPVNGLIKAEIRRRFDCAWGGSDQTRRFTVNINDLKEVETDLKEPKMDVVASGAEVEALMNLGPSDGNMRIKLFSIYTEGSAFPPAVHAVTLKGEEIVNGNPTGKKVTRKYRAKGRSD